jgi:hypothetical protein
MALPTFTVKMYCIRVTLPTNHENKGYNHLTIPTNRVTTVNNHVTSPENRITTVVFTLQSGIIMFQWSYSRCNPEHSRYNGSYSHRSSSCSCFKAVYSCENPFQPRKTAIFMMKSRITHWNSSNRCSTLSVRRPRSKKSIPMHIPDSSDVGKNVSSSPQSLERIG